MSVSLLLSLFLIGTSALSCSVIGSPPTGQSPGKQPPATRTPPLPTVVAAVGTAPLPSATKVIRRPTSTPTPSPTPTPPATRRPVPSGTGVPLPTPPAVPLLATVADKLSAPLADLIARAVAGKEGNFGVAVKNLATGELATYNADRQFEAASLYKLNLMYGAFEQVKLGKLSFSDKMTISEKAAYGYGDGDPTMEPGEEITVWEAVERAITVSDNTCAHALLEKLPIWEINQSFQRLGLKQTEINNGTRTSPIDMLRLMELIATGQALSREDSLAMLKPLLQQQVNDRLPVFLPEGVPIAHKTGNLDGLRHDVGIVYAPTGPYAIAVLLGGLPEEHTGSEDIAEVSRAIYDYFVPGTPTPQP
ncbi:MAG: serine hydrolase [Chloroflexota bacterium]